jgi:poly(A) polymerase
VTDAWIVGGALRDELLGRPVRDVDVAVSGDPERAARALAKDVRGPVFRLSEAFGAWRVIDRKSETVWDFSPLQGATIEEDLAQRDFTVNAMALSLDEETLLDPHGGRADLEARRVRMVSEAALADDPLRTLRAARVATELELDIEPATAAAVTAHAPAIDRVAPERVFAELKRIVTADGARRGLELMEALGLTAAVLPELAALRGVEQNVFHHADVLDHTLEVLDAVAALERDPAAAGLGEQAAPVAELLAEPLADELTRGGAMRFAALLHAAAKPQTRGIRADGRVTFIGHDRAGADLARRVLRRLRASQRLGEYVAAVCLHHLRVGFLVHERPLDRRAVWRYLRATAPYSPEVTVFTVADRLATRGRNAEPAIAAHLELARELLGPALARRSGGRPAPLVRGDELARELGLEPGPELGRILDSLSEAQYAGEVRDRAEAIAAARSLLARS